MSNRSSSVSSIVGLVVGLVGLLNVVLGTTAVISGAFPSSQVRLLAPKIGVGSIVFGLVMLVAGALWIMSGVGHFIRKQWASSLSIYVSPIIIAINLAGVIHLWGFVVNIGWAALATVAGVAIICYLSRTELASFFLISIAEHVFIVAIFAVLIYGEPVDIAESSDREMVITLEEIEPQKQPLLAEIIPEKRVRTEKTPTLPEIKIRSVTATDPGTEIQDSAPQLPKTTVQALDNSRDMILRSPGPKDREQSKDSAVPALNIESAIDSSKEPSLEIGPTEKSKDGTDSSVAREPRNVRDSTAPHDQRSGPSSDVARPSFAGEITGEIAGRKVVFWPKQPEGYKGTAGGSATIKFWVDPSGSVTRVEISKKSGSPKLDSAAREFVEQIRFAALPKNFQQRTQWGQIPISFELTEKAGQ